MFKHGLHLVTDTGHFAPLPGMSLSNVNHGTLSATGLWSPGDVPDGPTTRRLHGPVQFDDCLAIGSWSSEAAPDPCRIVDSWLYKHTQSPTAYTGILHRNLSNDKLDLLIFATLLA